jgi:2-polyprenyl-3-methyl-5-hydroxy-6-metoxy-1,4-benzoquinol methylase
MGHSVEREPESASEKRFGFGKNWSRYLNLVDETRISEACRSITRPLGLQRLDGLRFLDIGSGSGLSSLAAHRLGATVRSFDYDPDSVACTKALKEKFGSASPTWTVEQGSALDDDYLARLGQFDIVFSWGVLHHTGEMWKAIDNASRAVAPGGRFFISIYNDQGVTSKRWLRIKRMYVGGGTIQRSVALAITFGWSWGWQLTRDFVKLRGLSSWRNYSERGMSPWYDLVDWAGGYPFEVAKPEEIFAFLKARGFELEFLKTCGGGKGCNEFILTRVRAAAAAS